MGLFKKKSDPISDRARALTAEIAALEAQIQKLSAQKDQPASNNHSQPVPQMPAPPSTPQPRLRSTAMPHHRNAVPAPAAQAATHEPVFEEVNRNLLQGQKPPPEQPHNELGVRKYDLMSFWQRLKTHFRGPPASNPRLVNYLAAGSIQGLRPLRYERRVARNRFIVLVTCLVLVLWGVIAFFMKHR